MDEVKLTKALAQELIDAWEVDQLFDNEEEADALQEQNPELYEAYSVLLEIAQS
jgi:hypothetical protein